MDSLRSLGPIAPFAMTGHGNARQPENPARMFVPIAGGSRGGKDMNPVLAPKVVNAPVVDGRIGAGRLQPGMSPRSRSGGAIEVVAGPDGRLALRPGPGGFSIGVRPADAHLVQPDRGCSTGVVHRIDDVPVR